MGGFPEDEAKAFSVICWASVVASFAKTDKIIVKTPHEAMGIPTKEANAQGLKATRQAISMLQDQGFPVGRKLREEIDLIKEEVHCLMNNVYELGNGDLIEGIVAGFTSGSLDIPFAPSIYNQGKILPIRDNEGFIRVFNKGNLPLNDKVIAYHKEKMDERAKAEGREISFQMVTDDIYAISKGRLVGRPR